MQWRAANKRRVRREIEPWLGDCVPPQPASHRAIVRRKPPRERGIFALVPSIVMAIIICAGVFVMGSILVGAAAVALLVYSRLPI